MVHGDPLWCDFIISCTDSFCAHSFYLWWSACQDLTLIIIDPARVRAQCACMHTFLHFISGCEWTPHQSIFTRKLTSRFGGRMRKPIPLNGEIKLCFFFWVERWQNPFSWMDCHVLVGQDCLTFLCSFANLTLLIFAGGQHVISNKLITWIGFLKGKTSSFMVKLSILFYFYDRYLKVKNTEN
jgi:hypothetical protein